MGGEEGWGGADGVFVGDEELEGFERVLGEGRGWMI